MSELRLECQSLNAEKDECITIGSSEYSDFKKQYLITIKVTDCTDQAIVCINKDQAKQLIEHLTKEFGL